MVDKFVFWKSYFDILENLTPKKQQVLINAILNYVFKDVEPELPNDINALFIAIKYSLDNSKKRAEAGKLGGIKARGKSGAPKGNINAKKNENNSKTIAKQLQNNSKTIANRNINRNININKERDKQREKNELTNNDSAFLQTKTLSLSHEKFFKSFPNKKLDVDYTPPKELDVDKLIDSIKASEFLFKNHNLGFKWCCMHADEIIAGYFKDFKKQNSGGAPGIIIHKQLSEEEVNNLFVPIDDIEI